MSVPDEVRAFVALPVPPDLAAAIGAAISEWRHSIPGVRWNRDDNLHLTLRFLGQRSMVEVERLSKRLSELMVDRQPVSVVAGANGAFPGWSRPRVLWVGLAADVEVERLAGIVDRAASEIGLAPRERAFHGHITLGRVRDPRKGRSSVEPVRRSSFAGLGGVVGEAILYRSRLHDSGAVHSPMANFPLVGASS